MSTLINISDSVALEMWIRWFLRIYWLLPVGWLLLAVSGQDIKPLTLCQDTEVTLRPGNSGIIRHVQRENSPFKSISCTLIIEGLSGDTFIPSLGSQGACGSGIFQMYINGGAYCKLQVKADNINVAFTFIGGSERLNITIPDNRIASFEHWFYNKIAMCHGDLTFPEKAHVEDLSGIITHLSRPEVNRPPNCTITMSLPVNSTAVIFRLYRDGLPYDFKRHNTLSVENQTFNYLTYDPVIVTVDKDSGNNITLDYLVTPEGLGVGFLVLFAVITCGDAPWLENSVRSTQDTAWFPGSEVTYTCQMDSWKVVSRQECEYDPNTLETVWVQKFQGSCSSDSGNERCPSAPFVENAARIQESVNKTMYICQSGLELHGNSALSCHVKNGVLSWDGNVPTCEKPKTSPTNTTLAIAMPSAVVIVILVVVLIVVIVKKRRAMSNTAMLRHQLNMASTLKTISTVRHDGFEDRNIYRKTTGNRISPTADYEMESVYDSIDETSMYVLDASEEPHVYVNASVQVNQTEGPAGSGVTELPDGYIEVF